MSNLYETLHSYRLITNDKDKIEQADELYQKTQDLKAVDDLCKKLYRTDQIRKLLAKSNLNKRDVQANLDNFETDTDTRKTALKKAKKYIAEIDSILQKGTNLIIEGNGHVGTGKTFLSCAIALELIKLGIPCKFINVTSMIDGIRGNYDISELITVDVLIIDDLGKEYNTGWVETQLYAIINERYSRELPTIITLENDLNELKLKYGEKGKAIFDRLIHDFILIQLTGDSYRQKRGVKNHNQVQDNYILDIYNSLSDEEKRPQKKPSTQKGWGRFESYF